MSSWIVSNESLTITRNSLVNQLGISVEASNKLVRSWSRLNRYAVDLRYSESNKVFRGFTTTTEVRTTIQMYKSLRCLQYQCSEGSPEKDMPLEWFSLIGVINDIETKFKIDEGSSAYNDAEWE